MANGDDEELDELERKLRRGPSGLSPTESAQRELEEPPSGPSLGELERRLAPRGLLDRWRNLKRGTRIVLGVVAAAVLGAGLWKAPGWMLEHGHKSYVDCANSNYAGRPDAALGCEGAGHLWLTLAKLAPGTRDAAIAKDLDDRASEIENRMDTAAQILLDRAMLAGAADDLAVWMAQPGFGPDRRTTSWAFANIASTGAPAPTMKHAALARGSFDPPRAIRAAIALGDLEGATRIAGTAPISELPGVPTYEADLTRGIWLCLVGQESAGREALEAAKQSYQGAVHYEYPEAQMALLACGAPDGSQHNETYKDSIWAAAVATHADPRGSLVRLLPSDSYSTQAHDLPEPFFVDWLAGGERSPDDVVAAAGYVKVHVARGTTPWNVGGMTVGLFASHPFVIDPARYEVAAKKVEALLADVEAKRVMIAPLGEYDEKDRYRYDEAPRIARKDPAMALREAATALRLELASEYATRRDREGLARALAALPREDRDRIGSLVAPWLARVGDREGAVAITRPALARPPGLERLGAELSTALVALEGRDAKGALQALAGAEESLGVAETEIRSNQLGAVLGDDMLKELRASVGWVEAAALLMLKEGEPRHRAATPAYYEGEHLPKDWLALARAPGDVRREARLRMHSWTPTASDVAVLPAVFYVLHEVGMDGKDPEVYVDFALGLNLPQYVGTSVMHARAVALRMRGDADAATAWDARAEKLQPFFSSTSKTLLARLLRLE